MDTMRHPLLRILVALLIGVVTPLCCCQAMALAGSICDGRHSAVSNGDSCCHECPRDPAPDQQQDAPTNDHSEPPGECPSCPSCQGTAGGTGAKAEASLPVFEELSNGLSTIALAVLWSLPPLEVHDAPAPPGWAADPPFVKANREALRWHCALLI
jgi:hypothetical protein